MTGKAISYISVSAWRTKGSVLKGFAAALILSLGFGVQAAPTDSNARTNSPRTTVSPKASPAKSGKSKDTDVKALEQSIALGTVSLQQSSRGFRLFGNSGLTLNHSSVISEKVYKSPNPQYDTSYSYSFGMGLRLTKNYFSSVSFSLAHQPNALEEREQLKLRNTSLSFSRSPLALGGGFSLSPDFSVRLPVGREVVDRESLRFGIAPSATLGLPPLWTGSRLGTSYTVSGTYNNHTYAHHSSGNPNVRWGVNHSLRLAYPVVKGLTVSVGGNHGLSWTAFGTMREYVGHSEQVSWQVSPNASLSAGHTNQGEMYALDGVVYDFSFLSERNSIVFGRLSLSI